MNDDRKTTALDRDLTLYELVRHVAYAEHWLRHTDAFDGAVAALGMRWVCGSGLFVGEVKIPNPYEDHLI